MRSTDSLGIQRPTTPTPTGSFTANVNDPVGVGFIPRVSDLRSSTLGWGNDAFGVGGYYFTIPRFTNSSAHCTAFVAAPLRRLSATTHRHRAFGFDGSCRTRPTNVSS